MSEEAAAVRVGVRDVARLAGVSAQTVSRVLSGHASVREDTRRRVLEAVDTLGYRMNNVARALGTRMTRTIGVIASDTALYGPSAGIAALETAARAEGRWIATAYADATDAASLDAAAQHLISQGVDGIVVVAPHTKTLAALAQAHPGLPIRALHDGAGADSQSDGAGLAVAHLLHLGHRRIAELAGPKDWLEGAARSRGVAAALLAANVAPGPRWEGDWSAAAGFAAARSAVAALAAGVTGIAVANDQMALGLIAGLRAAGLGVPEQVSVTGFDDNPDAAFYRPALTTVRLDVPGEARRAVAALSAAPGPGAGFQQPAPPTLVVRASATAAAG
jgi:DNA-binding LacI/PurR family transcriptional regulator